MKNIIIFSCEGGEKVVFSSSSIAMCLLKGKQRKLFSLKRWKQIRKNNKLLSYTVYSDLFFLIFNFNETGKTKCLLVPERKNDFVKVSPLEKVFGNTPINYVRFAMPEIFKWQAHSRAWTYSWSLVRIVSLQLRLLYQVPTVSTFSTVGVKVGVSSSIRRNIEMP